MASICHFELKGIQGFRGDNEEPMQKANLYYDNKKVGLLSENPNGGAPIMEIHEDYQDKWKEAVNYFKEYLYEKNELASEEELFYFLLTIKEWERTYRQQNKNGDKALHIYEEYCLEQGYRTGGFKVYVTDVSESLDLEIEEVEPGFEWRKTTLLSLDELDYRKEVETIE